MAKLKDTFTGVERDFFEMTAVKNAISAATEGHPNCENNCVCDDPLVLEIRSPDVLTLTLIDLPGMTRLPLSGQPEDVSEQIEAMVKTYVDDKNTIILAVTPANADLANSDAVKIAREVDPWGTRTIGVLTKVDIVDKGTEHMVKEIIDNENDDVPFVWVPVKNRSQADINENKSVAAQRREEKDFFGGWFQELQWDEQCGAGIKYLSKLLHTTLVDEIRKNMHKIEKNVQRVLKTKKEELATMKTDSDLMSWKRMARKCMDAYKEDFVNDLTGRHSGVEGTFDGVRGGARIVDVYKGEFANEMKAIDPLKNTSDEQLLTVVKNARGHDDGTFLPHEALKILVRRNVELLLPVCQLCVEDVCNVLTDMALLIPIDSSSHHLKNWIREMTIENIEEWKKECNVFVENLIKMERRVNPDHPSYYSHTELAKMLADREKESDHAIQRIEPTGPTDELSNIEVFKLRVGTEFKNSPVQEYILLDGKLMNNRYEEDYLELKSTKVVYLVDDDTQSIKDNNWGLEWSPLLEVERFDQGRMTRVWCLAASKRSVARRFKAFTSPAPVRNTQETVPPTRKTDKSGEVDILKDLLKKYFDIVRIKLTDSIPKAIAFHIVDSVSDKLGDALSDTFLDLEEDSALVELMGVSEEDEKRRLDCEKVVSKLEEALRAITGFKTLKRTDPEYT